MSVVKAAFIFDALSAFSAENKCCFDHAHNAEPFCTPEHVSWNCFLWHLLKFRNDRGATIHSVLFRGITHHHCKRRHHKNKQQFFHQVTFASPTPHSPDPLPDTFVVCT